MSAARFFAIGFRVIRPWFPGTAATCTRPNSSASIPTIASIGPIQWSSDPNSVSAFVRASSSWMFPEKMSPPRKSPKPS